MSTGEPRPARGLIVAVTCLGVAASAALVSLGASIFAINGVFLDSTVVLPAVSTSANDPLLIMAIAGAVGAAVGLVVIHAARRTGWPVLLLTGTVLTAAHVLPLIGFPDSARYQDNEVVFAAMGAGAILVVLGLLGAASWLIHAGARGAGCVVAGLALAAPPLGDLVLRLVPIAAEADLGVLLPLGLALCGIGTAGAIGATVLIPMLRRLPEPESPPPALTLVGGIAAAIPVVPVLVARALGNPFSADNLNRANPRAFETAFDDLSLWLGMTGLMMFLAGMGLAAMLGSTSLGAAIAVGLVLFAVPIPLRVAMVSADSRAGTAALAVLGLVLAGLAAASRWRAWIAGGACALAGVVIVATRPSYLGGRVSEFLAACLLVLVILAVVTTVATGAAAVAGRTHIPAVLGTVAVAIQLGVLYSGTLAWHSGITGDRGAPGFEPPSVDPLTVASGVALLVGALLVVVLPLIRTPATPTPDAPPSDQAVPVAR